MVALKVIRNDNGLERKRGFQKNPDAQVFFAKKKP
jgi:hypothetical protein